MAKITTDSLVSQGDDQVFTMMEGQAVLMSVRNGKYYTLDEIGTRIWTWIETPTSIAALCDRLNKEFDVEGETCEADVMALLERMLAQNLVRVAPGA